jgi:hexulose-6-phosphate isomerase
MPLAADQILRPSSGGSSSQPVGMRRAIRTSMLPPADNWKSRLDSVSAAGFDGLAVDAMESPIEADELARAASERKLTIESVVCPSTVHYALSSADPDVQKKGVASLKTALTAAAMWRAHQVVITPAVVDESTPPSQAWSRSIVVLKDQILPLAGGFKLYVSIQVPTPKFILSPGDCNQYIDELRSPWARASLGVGDAFGPGIVGTPSEWIRTLGYRLAGLRLSDRHINKAAGTSERRNIGDGDVDWQAVRKAMSEAPYLTWVTADLDGGNGAYISNVRIRVDKFLAGFKPGGGPGA